MITMMNTETGKRYADRIVGLTSMYIGKNTITVSLAMENFPKKTLALMQSGEAFEMRYIIANDILFFRFLFGGEHGGCMIRQKYHPQLFPDNILRKKSCSSDGLYLDFMLINSISGETMLQRSILLEEYYAKRLRSDLKYLAKQPFDPVEIFLLTHDPDFVKEVKNYIDNEPEDKIYRVN